MKSCILILNLWFTWNQKCAEKIATYPELFGTVPGKLPSKTRFGQFQLEAKAHWLLNYFTNNLILAWPTLYVGSGPMNWIGEKRNLLQSDFQISPFNLPHILLIGTLKIESLPHTNVKQIEMWLEVMTNELLPCLS